MVKRPPYRYATLLRLRQQARDSIRGQLARVVTEINSANELIDRLTATRMTALRSRVEAHSKHVDIATLRSADEYQRGLSDAIEKLVDRRDQLTGELAPLQSALAKADQQVAVIEKLIERVRYADAAKAVAREAESQEISVLAKLHRQRQQRLRG